MRWTEPRLSVEAPQASLPVSLRLEPPQPLAPEGGPPCLRPLWPSPVAGPWRRPEKHADVLRGPQAPEQEHQRALCAVGLEARRGSLPRATSVGEAACLI